MPQLNTWNMVQGGSSGVSVVYGNATDTLTGGVPIVVPATETPVPLTNNALGVASVDPLNVYNPLTGLFDWSGLSPNDIVDLQIDVTVITSIVAPTVVINLGSKPWDSRQLGASKTNRLTKSGWFRVGDLTSSQFTILSDAACTCVVNSWSMLIMRGVS